METQDTLAPMQLDGKKVLISAGPMRTHLDPVRYVQNRSSGKMGLEIARAAELQGAELSVLLGPVTEDFVAAFSRWETVRYETPQDYQRGLELLFPKADIFFSVAAVLDFEIQTSDRKIGRRELGDSLAFPIKRVSDFAKWAGQNKKPHQTVIAFAAETGTLAQMLERAEEKRREKQADLIVLNPVTSQTGPETQDNEAWILGPGKTIHLEKSPKALLAKNLVQSIIKL